MLLYFTALVLLGSCAWTVGGQAFPGGIERNHDMVRDKVVRDNPDLYGGRGRPRPIDLPPWFSRRVSCSSSDQCPDKQCCRKSNGDPVNAGWERGWGNVFDGLNTENGSCSASKSGPGKICVPGRCDCQSGYECYRTVTGACCPPHTCWTSAAARADREHWRNCRPPTCFFPA